MIRNKLSIAAMFLLVASSAAKAAVFAVPANPQDRLREQGQAILDDVASMNNTILLLGMMGLAWVLFSSTRRRIPRMLVARYRATSYAISGAIALATIGCSLISHELLRRAAFKHVDVAQEFRWTCFASFVALFGSLSSLQAARRVLPAPR